MQILKKINWLNTVFLIATPIVAVFGLIMLYLHHGVAWQTWLLFAVMLALTGLSITAGYHRLFAHNTYKTRWPVRLLFALFGAASFEGSVLEWCTDHRNHHRYTDTERDPYNIKCGFWFAHLGWLIQLNAKSRDFANVADLAKDPILRWQHCYFPFVALLVGFALPTLIASFWGDAWAGLIVAGVLRMVINHHGTFCINSVCHLFGKRTYSETQSARDNWVTALFTYGEGYHNFHHQFPLDYRNGIRFYDYDPTKWLINGMSYIGLASDLRRISQEKIIKYRVHNDHRRLGDFIAHASQAAKPIYERMLHLIQQIEELEKSYKRLKDNMSLRASNVVAKHHVNERLDEYRRRIKALRHELNQFFSVWKKLQHVA